MDRITFFVDWRPVTSLPAHSPPLCSNIAERRDVRGLLASMHVPEGSETHSITTDALKSLRYRWRDDGVVVFELTLRDEFVDAVESYYSQTKKFSTASEFETLLSSSAIELRRIDAIARPHARPTFWGRPGPFYSVPQDDFERTILRRLAQTASDVIKRDTGHVHCFNAPNTRAGRTVTDRKRVSLHHIFLRIEPVQVDGIECCSESDVESLGLPAPTVALLKRDRSPLSGVLEDKLLVRLMRRTRTGPGRPAVFHLRRGFAALVDECMRLLPFLKQQHFLGQVPWPISLFVQAQWPASLAVFAVPLSLIFLTALALVTDFTVGQWSLAVLGTLSAWLVVFVAIEFGERRRHILAAFQRTAGVLEFGAVLGAAVGRIAGAAGMSRVEQSMAMEDRAAAILQRRIDLERDKRDGNRETLGIALSVVAAFFATFAAFGWDTPISSILSERAEPVVASSKPLSNDVPN